MVNPVASACQTIAIVSIVGIGILGCAGVLPAVDQQMTRMHEDLIEQMVNWKPDPRVADQENPFRRQVVAAGEEAVPALLARLPTAAALSDVVGSLGEIGSRRAFPGLMSRYIVAPDDAIAVSIGSTLDKASLIYMKDSGLLDRNQLTELLGVILGAPGRPITDRSVEELWQTAFDIVTEVRRRNIIRSRPTLG